MKCLICQNLFNVKRTINSLFVEPLKYRCPSCERRHVNTLKHTIIPIEKNLMHIFYFKDLICDFSIDAFDDYFELFLVNHLNVFRNGATLIVLESLTEELFQFFDIIDFSHIYVYCLYVFEI